MTGSLILWLSMIWLPVLMYVMLRNETKFKKNIAVGVTLPFKGRQDEAVLETLRRFTREELAVAAALVALAVPGMFLRGFGRSLTAMLVWVDLCVVLPYLPYVRCNGALRRIKAERGWRRDGGGTVEVDTSVLPEERWLSPLLFAPPLLLALLPLAWERGGWPLYLTNAVCVALFYLAYRYLYRNRAERVDDDRALTRVLTRTRRLYWGRCWLVCAWYMAALGLLFALLPRWPWAQMAAVVALSFGVAAFTVGVEFRLRHVQERLTAGSGTGVYVDEDDRWIWGLFYYDPRDSRLIVNNRVGLNTTMNLARPAGKVLTALLALILLALPLTGVALDRAGKGEIALTLTETELRAEHGGSRYVIDRAEIASAELREELPAGLTRTMGTGMERLLKGRFTTPETGAVTLCLDPTAPPFLLVTDAAGHRWLLGSRDPAETGALAAALAADARSVG